MGLISFTRTDLRVHSVLVVSDTLTWYNGSRGMCAREYQGVTLLQFTLSVIRHSLCRALVAWDALLSRVCHYRCKTMVPRHKLATAERNSQRYALLQRGTMACEC